MKFIAFSGFKFCCLDKNLSLKNYVLLILVSKQLKLNPSNNVEIRGHIVVIFFAHLFPQSKNETIIQEIVFKFLQFRCSCV